MGLKQLWSSRPGRRSTGKWSLLAAAVVAVAIAATLAFTGTKSSNATPANQTRPNQTESMRVLNPAPHQMAELNFLLGNYKCLTAAVPQLGRLAMHESTRKILDGNYYQMIITSTIPGAGTITAYWTFGWDSVDHNYIAQYFDNTGTIGTETSAGWQNGHLKFTGLAIAVLKAGGVSGRSQGWKLTSQDDLVQTGSGRYTDGSNYLANGHWTKGQVYSCQRAS